MLKLPLLPYPIGTMQLGLSFVSVAAVFFILLLPYSFLLFLPSSCFGNILLLTAGWNVTCVTTAVGMFLGSHVSHVPKRFIGSLIGLLYLT